MAEKEVRLVPESFSSINKSIPYIDIIQLEDIFENNFGKAYEASLLDDEFDVKVKINLNNITRKNLLEVDL